MANVALWILLGQKKSTPEDEDFDEETPLVGQQTSLAGPLIKGKHDLAKLYKETSGIRDLAWECHQGMGTEIQALAQSAHCKRSACWRRDDRWGLLDRQRPDHWARLAGFLSVRIVAVR